MQPKTPKLLDDIRDAAGFIVHVTGGKVLEAYQTDRLLPRPWSETSRSSARPSAVWRIDPDVAARIGDHPQIIAFRNVLIHGYDLIDIVRCGRSSRTTCRGWSSKSPRCCESGSVVYSAGTGSPAYLDYLDADLNGTVDLADLGEFRGRFYRSVF